MGKARAKTCPKCKKELPVSRKGKLPRHFREDDPATLCTYSGFTLPEEDR